MSIILQCLCLAEGSSVGCGKIALERDLALTLASDLGSVLM